MTIWFRPKGSGYSGHGSGINSLTVQDLWYRYVAGVGWQYVSATNHVWMCSFDFPSTITEADVIRMGLVKVTEPFSKIPFDCDYSMDIGL